MIKYFGRLRYQKEELVILAKMKIFILHMFLQPMLGECNLEIDPGGICLCSALHHLVS